MKDSKLIIMLRTFSASEIKELENFIGSPYFSKGRDYSQFLNTLKPFHPGFDDRKFTPENIFAKLYPGKKFDRSSSDIINTLSSGLFKLCKEFLIQMGLKEDYHMRQYFLLNKLRERKLYNEFEKEYKYSASLNEELHKGGVKDFLNQYYLNHCLLQYNVETSNSPGIHESLFKAGDYSALVTLIYGYRNPDFYAEASLHNPDTGNYLIDNIIECLDSEKLLENMKKNDSKFYPYVKINYEIYRMFKNPEIEEHYFSLKKLVEEYLHLFGHTEQYILFAILSSFCIIKLRKKNSDKFLREEFESQKRAVELGLYRYNEIDKFNLGRFRNIVGSAFDVNEIDWLESFVNKYHTELEINYIDNMKNYSYTYIYLGRKEYEKALESLIKVKYDVFIFKLDVKHLMLIIYYELGYYEQAYSLIDTFKHYISNTKDLLEFTKTRHSNFIKSFNILLRLKSSGNKKDLKQIEKSIYNEDNIPSKNWLLEKVKELERD